MILRTGLDFMRLFLRTSNSAQGVSRQAAIEGHCCWQLIFYKAGRYQLKPFDTSVGVACAGFPVHGGRWQVAISKFELNRCFESMNFACNMANYSSSGRFLCPWTSLTIPCSGALI